MVSLKDFLSLEDFIHRSLWKEDLPVWSVFRELNQYLRGFLHRIEIEIPPHAHLENISQISIGEGTVLEPGVFIQGPCIIGKNCKIRHGAYLRGGVILGDDCVIGHCTEVKHSVFLNGACAAHLCYVGDSIVGSGANLGAGVKCANLRLDRREIFVSVDGRRIGTHLKKFGAVIGDFAQIGCNCVLNPGTLVGRETVSHPLLNLGGTISPRCEVKGARAWTAEPLPEKILERLLT